MYRPSRFRDSSPLAIASVSLFSAEEGAAVCGLTSKVHIPFDFYVGEKTWEAGLYRVGPSEVPGTVTLNRSRCRSLGVLVQSIECPGQGDSSSARLLFYRQQDCYFLAQLLGRTITQ
jgi:hypothetical protein